MFPLAQTTNRKVAATLTARLAVKREGWGTGGCTNYFNDN